MIVPATDMYRRVDVVVVVVVVVVDILDRVAGSWCLVRGLRYGCAIVIAVGPSEKFDGF